MRFFPLAALCCAAVLVSSAPATAGPRERAAVAVALAEAQQVVAVPVKAVACPVTGGASCEGGCVCQQTNVCTCATAKPVVKASPCSGQCTCGCNFGGPCICASSSARPAPEVAIPKGATFPEFNGSHACSQCGRSQYSVAGFNRDGTHTHICNSCGHSWRH